MRPGLRVIGLAMPLLLGGCYFKEAVEPPPLVPPPTLERVRSADALASRQYFSSGMSVQCRKRPNGTVFAILNAAGQSRRVDVILSADFYAVTGRPDLVIMHDHYHEWVDTIRLFYFSPGGVRERARPHDILSVGYQYRLYTGVELVGDHLSVTEELRGGRPGQADRTRRIAIPLE